mgnify:CR=1 FL=1
MDNRILNTITQYDTLILSMKLYYSHTKKKNFKGSQKKEGTVPNRLT